MYSNPQGVSDEGTPSFDQSAYDELTELSDAVSDQESAYP